MVRWVTVMGLALTVACGRVGFDAIQLDDTPSPPSDAALSAIAQRAYVKASNTGAGDNFGHTVAVSADGSTLAVGATLESSAATGVNGTQADESAPNAGAVYIFTRAGASWTQQAYVKASNTGGGDYFGECLALSADGSTLAIGARFEDSAATGIDGDQADNTAPESGAVYVFTRSGPTWTQQAYVKASNTGAADEFGFSLALSADGATLAVGAHLEDSAATGINGDQADNTAADASAVYVFNRAGAWTQQAYVKASNTGAADWFGFSVALSADGSTLAVGARYEDSMATGIDGSQDDNSLLEAGAVYVFSRVATAWLQTAYVKSASPGVSDYFGETVALSGDGSTLAVGAIYEDSAASGVDGNYLDESLVDAGAVYVFARVGSSWAQQAYVKASNPGGGDAFGWSIALSGDGSTLAVGAVNESSAASGIDGDQGDNSVGGAGAAYVFTRTTGWRQQAYVKASNPGGFYAFGLSVALSTDASTLAVGAWAEGSAATGIDGDQADASMFGAGAAYVFR